MISRINTTNSVTNKVGLLTWLETMLLVDKWKAILMFPTKLWNIIEINRTVSGDTAVNNLNEGKTCLVAGFMPLLVSFKGSFLFFFFSLTFGHLFLCLFRCNKAEIVEWKLWIDAASRLQFEARSSKLEARSSKLKRIDALFCKCDILPIGIGAPLAQQEIWNSRVGDYHWTVVECIDLLWRESDFVQFVGAVSKDLLNVGSHCHFMH